jgi:O-antigen/teichoic acid export membrane protein
MIQETAKGSAILIIGQMASTAISALGSILVARLLGSTSYGLITIANIPVNIAMMSLNNGIRPALINHIVENRVKGDHEKITSTILAGFTINLSVGLVVTILLYTLSGYLSTQVFNNPELEQIIKILSLMVLSQATYTTASGVLVGLEKMTQRSLVNIFYSLLKTIIGPALVFLGYGIIGASIGYSVPFFLSGLFAMVYVNLKGVKTVIPHIDDFRSLISYSSPLFGSNLIASGIYQVLNFILPFYVSAALIGNLGAARSFTVLISFFLVPISTATLPLLSKLRPEEGVFEFVYQNIIKYETMIAYPVSAAVIALSGQMVEILYGGDYAYASVYIQLLMLGYFFIGFGDTVNNTLLNSQKYTNVILHWRLIYLAVGVPLGFILIPRYGVIGFQVTTLIAPRVGLLYTIWWVRKNMNIKLDVENTVKILFSAILGYVGGKLVLILVTLGPWFELILGGVTIALVYLISIILTGALTAKNIRDIKSITDQIKSTRKITDPVYMQLLRIAKE